MKTEELLLILGALGVGYLLLHKAPTTNAASTQIPPYYQGPIPSQSPMWGYPTNIMNPSASANNGQSWSTQDTAAIISGISGLGIAAINTFGAR